MFTGIIDSLGTIKQVRKTNQAYALGIVPDASPYDVEPGESVSVSGVCLTVESQSGGMLFFTAVHETILRTTLAKARTGARVNLERALRPADRLGGHIVLGHVDGVGALVGERTAGVSTVRTIRVPQQTRRFMAPKASVAIDGVSLTIVEAEGDTISVSLIPYTLSATTLGGARTGDEVNVECDVLARYVHQLFAARADDGKSGGEDLLDTMEKLGF